MIITKEVVKRAEAVKATALEYIKSEEPILFDAIFGIMTEHAQKLADAIRTFGSSNPDRIRSMILTMTREVAGVSFIAETLARDMMEARTNKKLNIIVKKAYQSINDVVEEGSITSEDEDPVDAALHEARNGES